MTKSPEERRKKKEENKKKKKRGLFGGGVLIMSLPEYWNESTTYLIGSLSTQRCITEILEEQTEDLQ